MVSNQSIAILSGSIGIVIAAAIVLTFHCDIIPSSCHVQPLQVSFDSKSYLPGNVTTITLKTNSSFPFLTSPTIFITSSENNTKEIPLTSINSTFATTQVTLKSDSCPQNKTTCLVVSKGDNLYIMYKIPDTNKRVYDDAVIVGKNQVSFSQNHKFVIGESFSVTVFDPSKSGNGSSPGTLNVKINSSNPSHSKSEEIELKLFERINPISGKFDSGIFSNIWKVTLAKYTNSSIPIINSSAGDILTTTYENSNDLAHVENINSADAGYGYANNIESFNQVSAPDGKKVDCSHFQGDFDYDGICDSWEDSGSAITVDLTNFLPGSFPVYTDSIPPFQPCGSSNPLDPICPTIGTKDVYVFVDAIPNMVPNSTSQIALQHVVSVFNGINLGGNNNPKLHIKLGGAPYYQTQPFKTNGLSTRSGCDLKHLDFPNDIDTLKSNNFLSDSQNPSHVAMSQIFHYALLGWKICSPYSTTSGFAEYKGNDLVITLGNFGAVNGSTDNPPKAAYPIHALEGTFMHELGHNLGLYHGGNDNLNCKPNYLSVMSYSRQIADSMNWPTSGVSSTLNYSGETLNPISELTPQDSDLGPINRGSSAIVFGSHLGLNQYSWQLPIWVRSGPNKIDSDHNPNTLTDPAADLNSIVSDTKEGGVSVACGSDDNPGTTLSGYNDWSHLFYQFRSSSNFDAGYGINYTSDAREMTVTDYNNFIKQNLKALKNEFHHSSGISQVNLTKVDNTINLASTSIVNSNYLSTYGNMSSLNDTCHGIMNNNKTSQWLCDRLVADQTKHLKANLLPKAPEIPQNLTGTYYSGKNMSDGRIELSWLPPIDNSSFSINNYKIERIGSGGSYQIICSSNCIPVYLDNLVKENTTYSYLVTANNSAGYGPSASVNVTAGNYLLVVSHIKEQELPQIKYQINQIPTQYPEIQKQITDIEDKVNQLPMQSTDEVKIQKAQNLEQEVQLTEEVIQKLRGSNAIHFKNP